MAKEPEEWEEERNPHTQGFFFFESNIPNGARPQMGGISLYCIVRPFIKVNHHY